MQRSRNAATPRIASDTSEGTSRRVSSADSKRAQPVKKAASKRAPKAAEKTRTTRERAPAPARAIAKVPAVVSTARTARPQAAPPPMPAAAAPLAPAPVPTPAPASVAPVAPVMRPNGGPHRPNGTHFSAANIPPLPPAKPVNFKVGDKAVHPAHGVGEVTAVSQRDIGGTKQMFYELKILDNGMKVMVPTAAATTVGLREIMSEKEANAILVTMKAREVAVDVQPWSRRFRVYTEMIKSGQPTEVAKVLRDMNRLKFDKDLSFGERRLLDQAKSLLMKELAFAKKMTEEKMADEVKRIFTA
jgi:CarD family transcriptional regulator